MHERSYWWRPEEQARHSDWNRRPEDRPYWWRDDNLPFEHDERRAERAYEEEREREARHREYEDDRRYRADRGRIEDDRQRRRRHRGLGEKMRAMLGADENRRDDPRERHDEPRERRDYRGIGPRLRADDDEDLREEINERLRDDPDLDASDILVRVIDNEAILDGSVRSKRDAERAHRLANDVRGIVYVRDRLRVSRSGEDRVRRATIGMGYDDSPSRRIHRERRRWS